MKAVIIGGVAGGASAAARLRRLDETAEILIFERSGYVSYANCGLPYYIGGTIQDRRALTLQTPESFWNRFHIDVRVRHEVTGINRGRKTVTVRNLATDEVWEESYDKLLMSPGAVPVKPELPGVESRRIRTLRTVEDTFGIRETVIKEQVRSAVVIGGGFIGVEVAENLQKLGLIVSLIQRSDHILAPLDADMASFLHAHMRKNGVELLLKKTVTGFEESEDGIIVGLEGESPLLADMAILAIGVLPESGLAKEAGLTLGVRGSIVVNDHMQTSDPDIYAVGDAVSVTHSVTKEKAVIALAGPANKQGRIAADHMAGLDVAYQGSPGSSILKVFDMTAAFTGLNEKSARAQGLSYEKVILSPASHASYYPGGKTMTLKLLFEQQTERILGAQIVGFDGVDKRLDVIATAMQAGMKVTGLKDLDLAYAPPYSSAKDPVNMAGFVAENVLTGQVRQFFYEDLEELPRDGSVILLDVRSGGEYEGGHAEGFETHIPLDRLRERMKELEREKPVYVMCQSGLRSYIACRILTQAGYVCHNFAGGYRLYESIRDDRFDENAMFCSAASLS
ncbi:MAG: FAD-dependent oxidoreductase [Lachnospiraceae bacterium]|jgi:NADPH-dependent 2,4-dienoyl-CoA reductase/sulfur reductase-like enzyme/rhodanese-related sulfurtransferase|nr:FAD-dependent oxidoreductase [Lachnospiraceae bacterium]